jgi:hypothetical protein
MEETITPNSDKCSDNNGPAEKRRKMETLSSTAEVTIADFRRVHLINLISGPKSPYPRELWVHDDQSHGGKAMSSFKGFDIDNRLGTVHNSPEMVPVCAEEIMDNTIVSAHQTIHNNHKISKNIHIITQQTEEKTGELYRKIEEIQKRQKPLQTALDAASGKSSLLSFLMEHFGVTVRTGYVTKMSKKKRKQCFDHVDSAYEYTG